MTRETRVYGNTNAAFARRLERQNIRAIYNTVVAPRDPFRNINMREEGRRIASERFERLYSEGKFKDVDTGDYFRAREQVREILDSPSRNVPQIKGVGYRDKSGAIVTYQVKNGAIGLLKNGEFQAGVMKVNGQVVAIG